MSLSPLDVVPHQGGAYQPINAPIPAFLSLELTGPVARRPPRARQGRVRRATQECPATRR